MQYNMFITYCTRPHVALSIHNQLFTIKINIRPGSANCNRCKLGYCLHCLDMSIREVPTLILTCLRCISKQPAAHLTEEAITRALSSASEQTRSVISTIVVNHVTDAGRYVDDAIPVSLFDTRSLTIDIKNSKVSAVYIRRLVDRSPELEELNVSGCFQVDDDIVSYIIQKCRKLAKLNIQNCRKLTDRCLNDLSQSGLPLRALDIGGNMNMTEQGVIQFLRTFPRSQSILELNISGLPVTESVVDTLVDRCRSLETLGIAYAMVKEENVKHLLKHLGKNLRSLNIAWLPCDDSVDTYTFGFFEHLNTSCPLLVTLDLCGIRTVTAATLQKFLEARAIQVRLVQIFLSNCLIDFFLVSV